MLKLTNTTSTALTANQVIPLSAVLDTNNSLSFSNNTIKINKAGYYDVTGNFVITATAAGDISVRLFANGVAIPEAVATETAAAAGNVITLPIHDIIKVIRSSNISNTAELTFVVSAACTLTSAVATVVEIR